MTPEELKQVEAIVEKVVKKHEPDVGYLGWLFVVLAMFIGGCFKGCGY